MDSNAGRIHELGPMNFEQAKKEKWMELQVHHLVQIGTCFFRIKKVDANNQEVILRPIPKSESGIK